MRYMDVHCHLDQYKDNELIRILNTENNDMRITGAAINANSAKKLLQIISAYPRILVCLGIHPEYPEYYDEFEEVKKMIINNKEKIKGIGEIGLPYYYLRQLNKNSADIVKAAGKELLIKFLDLAEDTGLPVVLHAIEETAECALEELKKRDISKVLFHWFEGELNLMEEIIKKEYYISVTPDIIHNRKYADFVSCIPLNNLVVESDGPWKYENVTGVPRMVIDVVGYLSCQRKIPESELSEIIYENSCKLYNIVY